MKGLYILSASYRSNSISDREQISQHEQSFNQTLGRLLEEEKLSGVVSLTTCNRIEFVVSAPDIALVEAELLKGQIGKQFSRLADVDAARHLFRLAAGLDSMVLGEVQIAGQLKRAYYHALENGWTDSALNRLFHRAFHVSKQVRCSTNIGKGNVSIASLGVKLAAQIVGPFEKVKVLVIGAGEIASLTVRYLADRGAKEIIVLNRTVERAWDLARECSGVGGSIDQLSDHLPWADIVISTATAPDGFIVNSAVLSTLPLTQGRCFLDLAFPRSIDPKAGDLEGVYLMTIDDLKGISDQNQAEREQSREEAEFIVERAVEEYPLSDALQALGDFSRWVDSEVDREERRVRRLLIKKGLNGEALTVVSKELRRAFEALATRLVHSKRLEIRSNTRNAKQK